MAQVVWNARKREIMCLSFGGKGLEASGTLTVSWNLEIVSTGQRQPELSLIKSGLFCKSVENLAKNRKQKPKEAANAK